MLDSTQRDILTEVLQESMKKQKKKKNALIKRVQRKIRDLRGILLNLSGKIGTKLSDGNTGVRWGGL